MVAPSSYPHIVYKYRNWLDDFNKDLLRKNELFLPSPKDINDPFDCKIQDNLYMLDTDEKKKKFVDSVLIRLYPELEKGHHDIQKLMNDYTNRLIIAIEKEQTGREKIEFDDNDKYYGVLSLSAIWDSILMWSHYSDKHRGYCIGFWEQKLRNSGQFAGGPVQYTDYFPQMDPLDNDGSSEYIWKKAFTVTHTKAKSWEYEKEYRLTKLFFENEIPPTTKQRKVIVPDSFIAEIIIGMNCLPETEKEIVDLAKNKKIPIFKTKKIPFQFKLERIKIS